MPRRVDSAIRSCVIVTALLSVHACARSARESTTPSREDGAAGQGAGATELVQDARAADDDGPDGIVVEAVIAEQCGVAAETAYFATGSAELRPDGEERLLAIAQCLTVGPLAQREVVLVGHTDPRGDEAYNEQLGIARAHAVADFLRGHGVSSLKMKVVSVGEREAADDEDAWAKDRRVEIMLVPAGSHLFEPSGDPLAPAEPPPVGE